MDKRIAVFIIEVCICVMLPACDEKTENLNTEIRYQINGSNVVEHGINNSGSAKYVIYEGKNDYPEPFDRYIVSITFDGVESELLSPLNPCGYAENLLVYISEIGLTEEPVEIDINEYLTSVNRNYRVEYYQWGLGYDINNSYCINIGKICDIEKKKTIENAVLCIDLENKEPYISDTEELIAALREENTEEYPIMAEEHIFEKEYSNFLEINGYKGLTAARGRTWTKENYKLLFNPGELYDSRRILSYLNVTGIENRNVNITAFIDRREGMDNLIECLFGSEDNICWDGVIIKKEGSRDGREHEIGSFEEFAEWYK